MDEAPIPKADARRLRVLARLVTLLTAVMIAGVVTIVALLVIRLNRPAPAPVLPATLELPADIAVYSVTAGPGWYLVVTRDQRILVFSADGTLESEMPLHPAD